MSRKIIHLTPFEHQDCKAAFNSQMIVGVCEHSEKSCTEIVVGGLAYHVLEPYDVVLRMWADALSSED